MKRTGTEKYQVRRVCHSHYEDFGSSLVQCGGERCEVTERQSEPPFQFRECYRRFRDLLGGEGGSHLSGRGRV